MRSLFESLVVSSLLFGCATPSSPPEHPAPAAAPTPLPSLDAVVPLNAGEVPLREQAKGRVVVIDLWATWCEPCRESMPKIDRLAAAYADTELLVAGVHVGPSADGAARFVAEAGIGYPMHIDPDFRFTDAVGSRSVPLLLVVDRDGSIVHRTHELDHATLELVRRLVHG